MKSNQLFSSMKKSNHLREAFVAFSTELDWNIMIELFCWLSIKILFHQMCYPKVKFIAMNFIYSIICFP